MQRHACFVTFSILSPNVNGISASIAKNGHVLIAPEWGAKKASSAVTVTRLSG